MSRFPYALGSPSGRRGYEVQVVHFIDLHAVTKRAFTYADMHRLLTQPDAYRPCKKCMPSWYLVQEMCHEALNAAEQRGEWK